MSVSQKSFLQELVIVLSVGREFNANKSMIYNNKISLNMNTHKIRQHNFKLHSLRIVLFCNINKITLCLL